VKTFRQGGVKVDVWRNTTQQGAEMYNTAISNRYKDDAIGDWKDTKNFSPTDLAVVSSFRARHFRPLAN
jgi:hypothetical protein